MINLKLVEIIDLFCLGTADWNHLQGIIYLKAQFIGFEPKIIRSMHSTAFLSVNLKEFSYFHILLKAVHITYFLNEQLGKYLYHYFEKAILRYLIMNNFLLINYIMLFIQNWFCFA